MTRIEFKSRRLKLSEAMLADSGVVDERARIFIARDPLEIESVPGCRVERKLNAPVVAHFSAEKFNRVIWQLPVPSFGDGWTHIHVHCGYSPFEPEPAETETMLGASITYALRGHQFIYDHMLVKIKPGAIGMVQLNFQRRLMYHREVTQIPHFGWFNVCLARFAENKEDTMRNILKVYGVELHGFNQLGDHKT